MITATDPRMAKKRKSLSHDFKTTAEGKLVIEVKDEHEMETEGKKKKSGGGEVSLSLTEYQQIPAFVHSCTPSHDFEVSTHYYNIFHFICMVYLGVCSHFQHNNTFLH